MNAVPPAQTFSERGFTLVELAVVMLIISLLLGGLLLPLSAQQDIRANAETQKLLAEARDALVGYAIANGRLPCPASSTSYGKENPVGGGTCINPYDGYLPAATLGLSAIDSEGFALDAWGSEQIRRIHYAVTESNTKAFTTTNGMKTTTMALLTPDLQVCSTGTGMISAGTASATCATNKSLSTDAVAVIYSLGKNAGTGGTSTDESPNPNPQSTATADRAFVNATLSSDFDDSVIWLSKNVLFNRLVSAGTLP